MNDTEDPLDLLSDDGDGVVEMSLLEELEKRREPAATSAAAALRSSCSVHRC
jgi:hypothetical protein